MFIDFQLYEMGTTRPCDLLALVAERLGDFALIENGKRIRPRASIVPRGGLRRYRASA